VTGSGSDPPGVERSSASRAEGDRGVAGIARRDGGGGDELGIGIERDVALVPVEGSGVGLVAVAGVGVDRADDPVVGHPPGDPDPAVGPVLEVLAEDGGEERRRLPEVGREWLVLKLGEDRFAVAGERIHERSPCLGVLPVDGGLARGAVLVVAAEDGAERGLAIVSGR
jgi:hypothetical protein